MEFKENLIRKCEKTELIISELQADQFEKYYRILLEWNAKMNLTAITTENEVIEKHFIDSLFPLKRVDLPEKISFSDVGTGAGFPSIPWLIYNPEWKGTLLDGSNKRVLFLKEVIDQLGLQAEAVHTRGEEAGKLIEYREQFDVVTARAVSNLTSLCEYTLPLVKSRGKFLALKGPSVEDELKDARLLIHEMGCKLVNIEEYQLPEGDKRTLLVIEKVASTPQKYPRPTAQIKKDESKRKNR